MADSNPSPELKTYQGNCHCGAFKYFVKLPEPKFIMEYNYSICSRKACKQVYLTADIFTIEKNNRKLKEY
jgi:hypothetical protein